jgi:hypothetical protein
MRHCISNFLKSWDFLVKFHSELVEDWSFSQAHFDSAFVRKCNNDIFLQSLQYCAKIKGSAGISLFIYFNFISESLLNSCKLIQNRMILLKFVLKNKVLESNWNKFTRHKNWFFCYNC